MGVYLLQDVAQWAGATAVLAGMGCLIAALLGVQMSASIMLPGEAAFALARTMAVMGSAAVFVAGATCTLYYWLIGVASERAAITVEAGLLAGAVVFLGMLGMLHERSRARAPR
jgi:hypothetical protein